MVTNLTGRTRYQNKRGWFNVKTVLQVEHKAERYVNYGPFIECETYTVWKDATPADYLNCPAIAARAQ